MHVGMAFGGDVSTIPYDTAGAVQSLADIFHNIYIDMLYFL